MSKQCCEWHDHLPEMWQDDTVAADCFGECGLAGMGRPALCCISCPEAEWFTKGRGMSVTDIDFAKYIMALPPEQRP